MFMAKVMGQISENSSRGVIGLATDAASHLPEEFLQRDGQDD